MTVRSGSSGWVERSECGEVIESASTPGRRISTLKLSALSSSEPDSNSLTCESSSLSSSTSDHASSPTGGRTGEAGREASLMAGRAKLMSSSNSASDSNSRSEMKSESRLSSVSGLEE